MSYNEQRPLAITEQVDDSVSLLPLRSAAYHVQAPAGSRRLHAGEDT